MKKLPIGTFVNMASIVVGTLLGLLVQQVFPENVQTITLLAVGLGILLIGLKMALKLPDELWIVFILSLILGGVFGELLGVKTFLDQCELLIRENFSIGQRKRFSEGLMAAFILFCASPITIIGAIEEGMQSKRDLLFVKSLLDGVTSIALASAYGIGVLFSIIPLLLIQGGFTQISGSAKSLFTKSILAQISAVGGVLLIALSLKIMEIKDIPVGNLLPALVFVVLLTLIFNKVSIKK